MTHCEEIGHSQNGYDGNASCKEWQNGKSRGYPKAASWAVVIMNDNGAW